MSSTCYRFAASSTGFSTSRTQMAKSGQCSSHQRQPVQRSALSTTGVPFGIQAEALPGAEGGADAAGLAPVPVDVDAVLRVGLGRDARPRREPYPVPGLDPVLSPNLPLDPLIGSPLWSAARLYTRSRCGPKSAYCALSMFLQEGVWGNLAFAKKVGFPQIPYPSSTHPSSHPRLRFRKLRSRLRPSVVRIDSGWNWTPYTARSR